MAAWLGQNYGLKTVTLTAGQSLTGRVNRLVKLNGDGHVIQTVDDGDVPVGIVVTDPGAGHASGAGVVVALLDSGGVATLISGSATITAGQVVGVATGTGAVSGRAKVTPAAGEYAVGVAISSVTAIGQQFSVLLGRWKE